MLALFIARRIAVAIVLLLVISFIIYGLLHLAPGSPERLLLGKRPADPAVLKEIRAEYHLNDSFLAQYWYWLSGALHFDFGRSIYTSQPVTEVIQSRIGVSFFLGIYGFIGTMFVGVLAGMYCGMKSRSFTGRAISAAGFLGLCVPAFAVAIILLYVFAVELGWFPAFGAGEGFVDRLWHLTLPATVLIVAGSAFVLEFTRTAMVQSLAQDYVGFARARGLSRMRVLFAHALRNALIPIVTTGGSMLAFLLIGTVVVESTFALPGLGSLLLTAVKQKDIPMVQALGLLIATMVILGNLMTDLLYLFVDPRIRYGASAA